MAEMKIIKYLGNLGYGTRREVTQLIKQQGVTRVDGSIVRDGDSFAHDEHPATDERIANDGQPTNDEQAAKRSER